MLTRTSIERRPSDITLSGSAPRFVTLGPRQALAIPFAFTLAILALTLLPTVRRNTHLTESFWIAAATLLAWCAALFMAARRSSRTFLLEIVLRKQHYLQACAQLSVLLYWGWYWREVYDSGPLIAAQLAFAYAFDILLSWSRRDVYTLGFGPFPIIFSINLFLWFKPDWFYLQFVMVALGFAAKELIRWNKDGRKTHIFNPSSFPLAIFSLALLLTHSTNLTWGPEIAETQFRPPYIYLWIFLAGLPGQFLFGVTSMTMSAVVTMYAFGLLYLVITGTYFFFENIPIAVFLGMHLLFTDPSTSPRTELGRIIFGMFYASSVIALAPYVDFYDKLLAVPLLNLTIKLIDRGVRSPLLERFDPAALGRALTPRRRNLAYMSLWTAIFVTMSATHTLGHTSRGYWVPFWQQACREGRLNGCRKLAFLEDTFCRGDSGWACNDLGLMLAEGRYGSRTAAGPAFQRACDLGFAPGCENVRVAATGTGTLKSAPPRLADYSVLLMEGKGPLSNQTPFELYQRACRQGWMAGCESLGLAYLQGQGTERDPARAAMEFDKACAGNQSVACASVAYLYSNGEGVARDDARARVYLKRACDLGMAEACGWLKEATPQ